VLHWTELMNYAVQYIVQLPLFTKTSHHSMKLKR